MIELSGSQFEAKPLTDADAAELQALLEDCADYFNLVLGREPGPADALSVFYAGPEEGQDPNGKILLGIIEPQNQKLVGVLDAFRNYPTPETWYIGLLLLDPRARRGGLGAAIVDGFASKARAAGAKELQLNVVEQNKLGRAFWHRNGFVEIHRWQQHFGERDSTFIRMSRRLD